MPDDNTSPLSTESALSMMFETPAAQEDPNKAAPAATDDNAAPAADNAAATDDNAAPAADNQNTSDDAAATTDDKNAPADEGNTNADSEDPGDALPPIEAPASWTTEEKAEWNGLSRKAQEAIQRREQDNTTALRNAQNSAAEQRKAADAEVTRLKGLTSQVESYVNDKVADLQREFPDVKSEADLIALSQSDPARYLAFDAKIKAIASASQAREAAAAELAKQQNAQNATQVAEAKEQLLKEFPTWSDPAIARKELAEVQDYAIKLGVPEAAARAAIDPMTIKMAHKAMLYDRAQADKAKAIVRTPPRVLKPGTQSSTPKADAQAKNRQANLDRLTKSGDVNDAVALMFEK